VRTELRHEIGVLRSDLVGEISSQITRLVLWLVSMLLTAVGLTFAAGRLG
jgi:hypothetical protein